MIVKQEDPKFQQYARLLSAICKITMIKCPTHVFVCFFFFLLSQKLRLLGTVSATLGANICSFIINQVMGILSVYQCSLTIRYLECFDILELYMQ